MQILTSLMSDPTSVWLSCSGILRELLSSWCLQAATGIAAAGGNGSNYTPGVAVIMLLLLLLLGFFLGVFYVVSFFYSCYHSQNAIEIPTIRPFLNAIEIPTIIHFKILTLKIPQGASSNSSQSQDPFAMFDTMDPFGDLGDDSGSQQSGSQQSGFGMFGNSGIGGQKGGKSGERPSKRAKIDLEGADVDETEVREEDDVQEEDGEDQEDVEEGETEDNEE